MPSIKCTNCGAVLKTQAEIPAGKKVKCPKCNEAFVVQAAEEALPAEEPKMPEPPADDPFKDMDDDDAPPPKKKSRPADADEEAAEEEGIAEGDAPVKKKRRGRADNGDVAKPKKKSNTMLYVLLGVGGLFLSCCLCCGGWTALNWDEFKKGFDKGFDEAQKKQIQKKK